MFSKKKLLTLFFTEDPWATISVTLDFKAVTQNFWKIIFKFSKQNEKQCWKKANKIVVKCKYLEFSNSNAIFVIHNK